MSDLKFNKEEFLTVTHELVPLYQQKYITEALDHDLDSEVDFDQLGLMLTGEKRDASFIVPMSAPNEPTLSMWNAIKLEIYDYLCTKSRKYSKERNEANITVKNIVTILATSLAASFNIAIGVITGAVTLALLSALKIGKNAWCETNKHRS